MKAKVILITYVLLFTCLLVVPAFGQSKTGVTSERINIRSGPGLTYKSLGWLEKGRTIEIRSVSDDGLWYEIGEDQWVLARLVRVSDENTGSVEPIQVFEGEGMDTIDISEITQPAILRFIADGDQDSGFASISGGESDSEFIPPLVSGIGLSTPFQYAKIINRNLASLIPSLDIIAPSTWRVEIWPLSAARTLSTGTIITGMDDEVIKLDVTFPISLTVQNDSPVERGYIKMDALGTLRYGLMNTEFATLQTIRIDDDVEYIEVHSDDLAWSLSIVGDAPTSSEPPIPTSELPIPTTVPTRVPSPTPTPAATPTITAKSATSGALRTITGNGDDLVDISEFVDQALALVISGNAADDYFGITSYDDSGSSVDLLVNTSDPYLGTVPINIEDESHLLEIKASGSWTVLVYPLAAARRLTVPGSIEGEGDDVFIVEGSSTSATITGNRQGVYFGLHAYSDEGRDLLVNTTDPYKGTVRLPGGDIMIVVVRATGEWTFTAK